MISEETRRRVEHARALSGGSAWTSDGGIRRWDEALDAWRDVLVDAGHPDHVYDDWVRALAEVAGRGHRPEVTALCREYLLDHRRAHDAWLEAGRLEGAARCLARSGDPTASARTWERVGAFARAAAAWEDAGELAEAARCWDRAAALFGDLRERYLTALALLNLGLVRRTLGEPRHRGTLSRAMILLMEEADEAESSHRTDRALACYHALIHVGRETGSHENLAEGFLNCIRLMGERDHRFFALQYFHDFAEASLELGEHQAAAEVLRDASAFCRRSGLLYTDHFLGRSAEAFEGAARAHLDAGAPAELAENALLAALDAHNRRGDVRRVRGAYAQLAALPLSEGRRRRYAELAARSVDEPPVESGWTFRGYFDDETAYPPLWRTHLLEADGDTDPFAPVEAAVGDRKLWEVVRRRSFLVALARARPGDDPIGDLEAQVTALGGLGSPLALEPLARLQTSEEVRVRAAVARALRFLPYRRALELLHGGLSDPETMVREEAHSGLRYLVFPGAFVPLIRLYREHTDPAVRREVVLALGRLVGMDRATSRDALDFLLHALREGADPQLTDAVRTAVSLNATAQTLPTLERHLLAEPEGEVRTFLERLVSRVDARRIAGGMGL